MSELPSGWIAATLQDVATWSSGGTPSRSKATYYVGAIAWFKTGELGPRVLKASEEHISEEAVSSSSAKIFPKGSVALAMYGATIGKTSIFGIDAATNQACAVGIPDATSSEFLYYFLVSQEKAFTDAGKGGAQPNISQGIVKTWPLLLPPSNEQTRIVEKLEELLSDLDAGVAELKAAQKKLVQYRQSLLKAAVEGKLTEQWRAQQSKSSPLSPGGTNRQDSRFARITPEGCDAGMQSTIGVGGEGDQTADSAWLTQRARDLRRDQAPMEQSLWQQLRAKRFAGFKFRRQQPIGRYIVDFVCFDRNLVIELDGSQHAEASDNDARRDDWLREQGFRVLRFWNNEWLAQQDSVLEAIWLALHGAPPLPNPSPTRGEGLKNETGAELLQRILTERRARWEAKQLAKFKEQGKAPPKDWQSKYPEPVKPDTSNLPELPVGWVWASVDQVAEVFLGKMLDKTKHTSGTKMPYLRNVNVRWGNIQTHDISEMFFENDELDRYGLLAGDVLVCEGGEPGRAAICNREHEILKYQKALHRVRLFDLYEPELLVAFLEFSAKTGRLERTFTGSTINHFTKESFLALQIPIAPLTEQREIVETLLLATNIIDEQKSALAVTFKQSAAQRKNILKAAFSGQLVPQDPNDEPAGVLLERIRAERAVLQTAKVCRVGSAFLPTDCRHLNCVGTNNRAHPTELVPQDPNDEPAGVLLERIRAERAVLQTAKVAQKRTAKGAP